MRDPVTLADRSGLKCAGIPCDGICDSGDVQECTNRCKAKGDTFFLCFCFIWFIPPPIGGAYCKRNCYCTGEVTCTWQNCDWLSGLACKLACGKRGVFSCADCKNKYGQRLEVSCVCNGLLGGTPPPDDPPIARRKLTPIN